MQFLFTSTFYGTYKTQYELLTMNPYEIYQNVDLNFSYDETGFKQDDRIKELSDKMRPLTKKSFEKLILSMIDSSKFAELIYSMLSINGLDGFSTFLKAGMYSIALEMITSIVSSENKENKVEDEEILMQENEELKKELQKKLHKLSMDFFEANNLTYKDSMIDKRINSIYNPFNRNKLAEAYEMLGIVLTPQNKKNIDLRNKFLHGVLPYKSEDYKQLGSQLFYINLELNFLVSSLIYKYIGYSGPLKNLTKIYMEHLDIKEIKESDPYYNEI